MTVQSEIDRINKNINDSYNACEIKKAVIPSIKNSNNLAETINSIPNGGSDSFAAQQLLENVVYGTNKTENQVIEEVLPKLKNIVGE